jgi:hypothetical protein
MSLSRMRPDRPGPARARGRRATPVEVLETRQLLSGSNFSYYNPADLPNSVKPGNVPLPVIGHPIGIGDQTLASLGNQGKSVTGHDRNGTTWTITVYGPGQVIVSDVTNDGVLDDDIATIQLVGTTAATHVIGQTVQSTTTLNALSSPLDSSQQVVAPSGEISNRWGRSS